MKTQQAKLILQAYRLGGQDANDSEFTEALRQLKNDPELAKWYQEEQAIESTLSRKIQEAAQPPTDLKSSILAGFKIVRPTPWWTRRSWLAVAASILITLGLGAFWFGQRPDNSSAGYESYRTQMLKFLASRPDLLQFQARDIADIRKWLKKENAHDDFVIPAGLQGRPSMGCRVLPWQGHTVTFICFDIGTRKVAHLFVIDRTEVFPSNSSPRFFQEGHMMTANWNHGRQNYLLVAEGAKETLEKLL